MTLRLTKEEQEHLKVGPGEELEIHYTSGAMILTRPLTFEKAFARAQEKWDKVLGPLKPCDPEN